MKTVLCIVDMQDHFKTSTKVIDKVIHQIKLAKKRNGPVVVLEFAGCGPTNERVKKELKRLGKKKVHFVTKVCDDGAGEVVTTLKKKKIKPSWIRVCGVNACYCVGHTVETLGRQGYKVEAVKEAINCLCSFQCLLPPGGHLYENAQII